MFSRIKRKRRLKEFGSVLGIELDIIKELAIITVASADPKLATNKDDLIYSTIPTVLDTIAFAAFTNRCIILSKVQKEYIAVIFTQQYTRHLSTLASYAYSINNTAISEFLDNRLSLFELAYLNSKDSCSSSMLNLYSNLLIADCHSDELSLFDSPEQIPLSTDFYTVFTAKAASTAYFNAFSGYFNTYISAVQEYLTN